MIINKTASIAITRAKAFPRSFVFIYYFFFLNEQNKRHFKKGLSQIRLPQTVQLHNKLIRSKLTAQQPLHFFSNVQRQKKALFYLRTNLLVQISQKEVREKKLKNKKFNNAFPAKEHRARKEKKRFFFKCSRKIKNCVYQAP